jgi:hypothetical protein
VHAKACLKQANNVLPKMHFSTSIQHVIGTKTRAGIDSLKLAWLTHNKRWYSSTPLVMTRAKSKTCVLVHENSHAANVFH